MQGRGRTSSVDLLACLNADRSSLKSSKGLLGIHPWIASRYCCCMSSLPLYAVNHLCSKACSTLSLAFSSKARRFRTKSLAGLLTLCQSGLWTIFPRSHSAAAFKVAAGEAHPSWELSKTDSPVSISALMTPNDHMSMATVYPFRFCFFPRTSLQAGKQGNCSSCKGEKRTEPHSNLYLRWRFSFFCCEPVWPRST